MDISQIRSYPQAPQPVAAPALTDTSAHINAPQASAHPDFQGNGGQSSQQESEQARLNAVESAARTLQQAFPEFQTFTIFKNNSGEFITRITNHTTGRVQYVPEVNILDYFKNNTAKTILALQA